MLADSLSALGPECLFYTRPMNHLHDAVSVNTVSIFQPFITPEILEGTMAMLPTTQSVESHQDR
jgi:hypothetical protein